MLLKNIKKYYLQLFLKIIPLYSQKTAELVSYKNITIKDTLIVLKKAWFTPIRRLFRFIHRLFVKIILGFFMGLLWFASFIWITWFIAPLILPAIKKMRRSRAEEMDEKHWIVYHQMKVYTIEQVQYMMKERKKYFEWQQKDNNNNITNYELSICEWKYKLSIKRNSSEMAYLSMEKLKFNNKTNTIEIILSDKEDPSLNKKYWILKWKNYIQLARIFSQVINKQLKLKKEILDFLNKDLSEFSWWKEDMTFLEYALYEYMGIWKIKPVKISEWLEPMTFGDMLNTAKEIETLQKIWEL